MCVLGPQGAIRRKPGGGAADGVGTMAALYPRDSRSDLLVWCDAHVAPFTEDPRAVGLRPGQAAAFAEAVEAARAAGIAQERARQAALAATEAAEAAFAALRARTGEAVRTVRAFAESLGEAGAAVYERAQIPPPARRRPAPPPAQPRGLRAELEGATGALTLRWSCAQPRGTQGTSYIVRRRLPEEAGFAFLGVTGMKCWTDATLPAGCAGVQYTVQGRRGDAAGPVSEILTVRLGREDGVVGAGLAA